MNFFSRSFPSNDHCELCPSSCLTCLNSTNCLTCINELFLLNNQCVEECPDDYYLSNQECLPCHPICNKCKGPTEDDCKSCSKGFEFDEKEKKCLNLCPNGNYFDQNENVRQIIFPIYFNEFCFF